MLKRTLSSPVSTSSSSPVKRLRTNAHAPSFSKFPRIYFWLNRLSNSHDFDPVDSPLQPDIEDEDAKSDVAGSIDESIRGLVKEAEIEEDNSEIGEHSGGVARKLFSGERVCRGRGCGTSDEDIKEDQENEGYEEFDENCGMEESNNSSSELMDSSEPIDESVHGLVEDAEFLGHPDAVARKLFADPGPKWVDYGDQVDDYFMDEVIFAVSTAARGQHLPRMKGIQTPTAITSRQLCH